MSELIIRPDSQLPVAIDELVDFIIITDEQTKACKAKVRAATKTEQAEHMVDASIEAGQYVGEINLLAQAKLGELLAATKPIPIIKKSNDGSTNGTIIKSPLRGREKTLPPKVTKKISHKAQEIYRNPEIVREVISKARENKEIPTSNDVYKAVQKKKKQEKQAEIIKAVPVKGKFKTIVIDPPWPIEKVLREVRPNQDKFEYKTMTIEEIKNLDIPSDDNCHLFLWTTQKYLPVSFEILTQWGFKYVFTMVWHKNGGFQPYNLPQYNCEFVVFGRKGDMDFLETKAFPTCFNGERREHSRKPENFYDLIRRVCPEPRIDMFSREKRGGFDTYGNESEKF